MMMTNELHSSLCKNVSITRTVEAEVLKNNVIRIKQLMSAEINQKWLSP